MEMKTREIKAENIMILRVGDFVKCGKRRGVTKEENKDKLFRILGIRRATSIARPRYMIIMKSAFCGEIKGCRVIVQLESALKPLNKKEIEPFWYKAENIIAQIVKDQTSADSRFNK